MASAPCGASLTGTTVSVIVSVSLCGPPAPVLPWSLVATVRITGAVAPGAVVKLTLGNARKALRSVSVPARVSVPLPEPPTATPPPEVAASVPEGTERVTTSAPAPTSRSAIEMPVIGLATSSVTLIEAGTVFEGASFRATTSIVAVAGVASSRPPASVAVNWKAVEPFQLATGTK